ncbi:lung seven transmembrane receptor-domain-containing protein [Boletus reticuloceps]|uniref:Lung seven transmembrane receptor-domain-containing protein n=1 Tax=Boletus reticuloceps TaxID=495285 RepID=A0A8I2YZA4_9AGAM|nr:lung seven transmembrane receptor-domain-containing protein [Boletus reticuloceps]
MRQYFRSLLPLLSALGLALAYEVPVSDSDYSRQVCSGVWGGTETYINVTFDASSSHGQVAMVVYEWKDVKYLGKITSETDDSLPVSDARVTAPTAPSQLLSAENLCTAESISPSFWDDPQGSPTPPSEDNTSPWLPRGVAPVVVHVTPRDDDPLNPIPSGMLTYTSPIQYQVPIVPVTVITPTVVRQAPTDVPFHPTYNGVVLFRNTFDGKLPASDYPKVNFYLFMFFAYALFGSAWAYICYKHLTELLPIQYYLSGLIGFLIIEMVANWVYYRYLNAHDKNMASTVFLFVVAILDAGRNALSFFMLLVVSLGLSVVRESLGKTMTKCQLLAGAHFIFGVLYAVGIVELQLESTSALVLLLFIIPLAFTLSGFLMWILYSLNGTMTQLTIRKQRYKLTMFKRLYYILLATVIVIAIFFVVSSMAFSDRLAEDELAQEDEDAEDYDLEALQLRTRTREDDEVTLVNNRREPEVLAEDHVVFEIGDEDAGSDDETENASKKRRGDRRSVDENGTTDEWAGLMGGQQHKDRND